MIAIISSIIAFVPILYLIYKMIKKLEKRINNQDIIILEVIEKHNTIVRYIENQNKYQNIINENLRQLEIYRRKEEIGSNKS